MLSVPGIVVEEGHGFLQTVENGSAKLRVLVQGDCLQGAAFVLVAIACTVGAVGLCHIAQIYKLFTHGIAGDGNGDILRAEDSAGITAVAFQIQPVSATVVSDAGIADPGGIGGSDDFLDFRICPIHRAVTAEGEPIILQ